MHARKKPLVPRVSIEGIFFESCTRRVPSYIKSNINLFKLLLKESGWKTVWSEMSLMSRIDLVSKNLLANCFRNFSKKDLKKTVIRKLKHFAVISIRTNWIQRSTQKNAGSGERRAELRRTARGQQFIIKVSSSRFYNQQEEVLNQKLLRVIDPFVFNNLAVENAVQQADTRQAHRQHDFSFLSSSE